MRRNRWALCGLLLVLGLALAGCGSSDGHDEEAAAAGPATTAADERISDDDWVDGASDACNDWADVVNGLSSQDDAQEVIEASLDAGNDFRDALDDLGEPADHDDAADLGDALDDYVDELDHDLDLLDDGVDQAEVDELESGTSEVSGDLRDEIDDADLDCEIDADGPIAATAEPATTAPPATAPSTEVTSVLDVAPLEPSSIIPDYGSDLLLDSYADLCFNGDMGSCDDLYQESPVDDSTYSYEGFGATCGGRLTEEHPGECVAFS